MVIRHRAAQSATSSTIGLLVCLNRKQTIIFRRRRKMQSNSTSLWICSYLPTLHLREHASMSHRSHMLSIVRSRAFPKRHQVCITVRAHLVLCVPLASSDSEAWRRGYTFNYLDEGSQWSLQWCRRGPNRPIGFGKAVRGRPDRILLICCQSSSM